MAQDPSGTLFYSDPNDLPPRAVVVPSGGAVAEVFGRERVLAPEFTLPDSDGSIADPRSGSGVDNDPGSLRESPTLTASNHVKSWDELPNLVDDATRIAKASWENLSPIARKIARVLGPLVVGGLSVAVAWHVTHNNSQAVVSNRVPEAKVQIGDAYPSKWAPKAVTRWGKMVGDIAEQAGFHDNLIPQLALAEIALASGGDPNATNIQTGQNGLAQLPQDVEATIVPELQAKGELPKTYDPHIPEQNIRVLIAYFHTVYLDNKSEIEKIVKSGDQDTYLQICKLIMLKFAPQDQTGKYYDRAAYLATVWQWPGAKAETYLNVVNALADHSLRIITGAK